MATSLGIGAAAFENCTSSAAIKAVVQAQSLEDPALGAKGTPYSVAFNKAGKQIVIPGAVPIEELTKTIDGLLK